MATSCQWAWRAKRSTRLERKEVAITFAKAKEIVRAAEEAHRNLGTYKIEDAGFEDSTHFLVVRGAAEATGDNHDPNFIIVPGYCRW
jgi:hypothetical protein